MNMLQKLPRLFFIIFLLTFMVACDMDMGSYHSAYTPSTGPGPYPAPLQPSAQPAPGYLPTGNYQQTCNNCRFSSWDNVLSCSCQGAMSQMHDTSLRVSRHCSFVENLNGNLACTQERGPGPRPEPQLRGNYNQTCSRCTSSPSELACYCQTGDGRMDNYSSMSNPARCNFIENINGVLTCTR